jgi:hypothetical protein
MTPRIVIDAHADDGFVAARAAKREERAKSAKRESTLTQTER